MIYKILPILFLGIFLTEKNTVIRKNEFQNNSFFSTNQKILASTKKNISLELYSTLEKGNYELPSFESFELGIKGYEKIKSQGKVENDVLTIIDFSLSSNEKRMWIIDMKEHKVIQQCLVSHGINSGREYANYFSNKNESNKSSLGFYITGETYFGKHGLSLKLDGLEWGVNDNARERAVVIHGANYVSCKLSKLQGYIGRSQGCPAVPVAIHRKVIDAMKNKSVLYIHHPNRTLNSNIISI
jgi:hypothetical protein